MQIAPGVHLVLSGGAGLSISHALDCSVFAIESSQGAILFDCGSGGAPAETRAALAAIGMPVAQVFLTHAHADHSGGGAAIKAATGAKFFAGDATAQTVLRGDERAMSLDVAKRAGVYPGDYVFEPFAIDHSLRDGEQVCLGEVCVTAVASPGHSADHLCYLVNWAHHRALIVGDALFAGGKVVLQDIWDCSVVDTCASIRRLSKLDFAMFLPGHGRFSLTDGHSHVDAAMQRINRLLAPELLV